MFSDNKKTASNLLGGIGQKNLLTYYCPMFCGVGPLSYHLHNWALPKHLQFVNSCDFQMLAKFQCNWLVPAVTIWNYLQAELILLGKAILAGVPY